MVRFAVLFIALAAAVFGQSITKEQEEAALREALSQSGGGPAEFIRVVEEHIRKYPGTPRRAEIERAIAKAAIDAKDYARVAKYGEKALEFDPADLAILEGLTRALLMRADKENAAKALDYSVKLEKALRAKENEEAGGKERARAREEMDGALGRAYILQARAYGNLGKLPEAVAAARKSFEANPTGDAARETARWLEAAGKLDDAVRALADAFMYPDPATTDLLRSKDRQRMAEIYRKVHGNEKGLGDLILEAYDRGAVLYASRTNRLRSLDPNARVSDPLEFTLSALQGPPLRLASLKGSVVVMDFWATWCGPCRAQKPLYEQVQKKYASRKDVVFLAVNTDEDRAVVEPFLEAQKWSKAVYFEDGLARALRISSIPTTVVFGKQGEVFTRFNGFVPDRFVEMLTERIEAALKE